MRQTKIVATIGPASEGRKTLPKVLDAGVNVVRINFSHGDFAEARRIVSDVRAYSKRTGRVVGIMQDLQGPKVRVGEMTLGTVLAKGSSVTLTTRPVIGDESVVPVQYGGLPKDVKAGDTILLDDGLLNLTVLRTTRTEIKTRVIEGGPLTSHKGINVPSATLAVPAMSAKDAKDLAFGLKLGVDFVALSFVKSAADIKALRRRINRAKGTAKIVAKIEKHEAVRNIVEIIDAADAVMVARGDLGVELPPEEVPLIQKQIIFQANRAFKPVITATQMLESMISHPRATRAEVSDVANAILDGTDAVMLSAESATGAFPVQAVQTMASTAERTERFFAGRPIRGHELTSDKLTTESVSIAACELAKDVLASIIVVPTASGWSARAMARHRVRKPIAAVTEDERVARELSLTWGVQPFVVKRYRNAEEMVKMAKRVVLSKRLAKRGQRMVVTAGLPLHKPGGTNMIQVHTL